MKLLIMEYSLVSPRFLSLR